MADEQNEQVEEYLTSLSDDDFAKLLLKVRPPGDKAKGRPGALDIGRELYRRGGRRGVEVEGAEHVTGGGWS